MNEQQQSSSPSSKNNYATTTSRASPISRLVYVQDRREAAAASSLLLSAGDCASIHHHQHPSSNPNSKDTSSNSNQLVQELEEFVLSKQFSPFAQIRLFPGGQVDEMESTSKSSDELSLILPISSGITVVGMAKGEGLCDIVTPYHGVSALHFIIGMCLVSWVVWSWNFDSKVY